MEKKSLLSQAVSLPNLLTYLRILMIPLCAFLYLNENYPGAACVLALSGATDIIDGKIARGYGMVTDLGKVIDPVADKLTQGVMILCLARKNPLLGILVGILVIKEAGMLVSGYMLYRKVGVVNSSRWYGKLCTVTVYTTLALYIIIPGMPPEVSVVAVVLCGGLMLLSFILYNIKFFRQLRIGSAVSDDGEIQSRDTGEA